MAVPIIQHEPLGIVVHDAAQASNSPKIMMWFWANEADVPEWERN
jgi:hypothetical protein